MSVPALRFKQEDGQDFPKWNVKAIGSALAIGSGKDYKHLSSGDIPVYGTGGYMLSVNDYLYDGESVCIGRKGTIDRPTLLNGKFWTVDTLFYTHSFKNCLPKFIYATFQRIDWKNYNEASGVPSLSKSTIEKIEIQLPSIAEQTKIANFLTAVDEKIHQLTQKHDLLTQYKKGVMQQIFSQELRFKDDDGQDFPNWIDSTLGDVAEIKRGAASQHLKYVENKNNGIRLIRINDFLNNEPVYVEATQDIKRFTLQRNDLLIAGTGATAGIVFRVPDKFENLAYSYNAPRIRVNQANDGFIYYYLISDIVLKQQQGLFVGNAQPFLDTDAIRGFQICLPSLPEQTKITNFLTAIDDKITVTKTQLQAVKQYKQGLLQQMFV